MSVQVKGAEQCGPEGKIMRRYACLEVRVTCSSCGGSIPVNGPCIELNCPACFETMPVSTDILGGFLNDLEEEYEGITKGQGRGGTVISGSGTYKYGYWRLPPRCSTCEKPLELEELGTGTTISCGGCEAKYHLFPAPAWLRKEVPSAVACVTPGPQPGPEGEQVMEIDESSPRLIVMSCPQCGGALSVSTSSERIMNCGYCSTDVYVPDEVWTRLHPVHKSLEWFVILDGKNIHQIRAERRRRDEREEKEFLRGWKLRNAPKRSRRKLRWLKNLFGVVLAILSVTALIGILDSGSIDGAVDAWATVVPLLIFPAAVLIPIWLVFKSVFSSRIGRGRASRQALADLAAKHSWKHEGAEYRSTPGYVDAKYRGRDIEIHPYDDYAIEVDMKESAFYLKTEPPGYPGDDLMRFRSGDGELDELFPIRYARSDLAERIETSPEEARKALAPLYWFLERWGGKIGRMQLNWSIGVHLAPGHVDFMDTGRYLLPEDMEPLLEDMMVLAGGLEAVASGRDPELPSPD